MLPSSEKNESVPLLKVSILIVLLIQSFAMIARSFTMVQLKESGVSILIAKDLSWLVVPVVMGLLTVPILRENWSTLKFQFLVRHLTLKIVFVSVALGLILRSARWASLIAIASFQGPGANSSDFITGLTFAFICPSAGTLAITILVSAILTPLLEETINRGFILQSLLPRGRWVAIAGSSILFGIFHTPTSIPFVTAIGFIFALQYLNSGSLWACILTHATYNALAILDWQCSQIVWNPLSDTPITKVIAALALAVLVMSLVLAIFMTQKNWFATKPGRTAPRS